MQPALTDLMPQLIPAQMSGSFASSYTLSNDGTTPNTVLDITDSTGIVVTKSISGSFTPGSGNGGMAPGLVATLSTGYHVWGILVNGKVDFYFDTSATAANIPSNATKPTYLGWIFLDATVHIKAFTQLGQYFYWTAIVTDLNAAGPDTTPHLTTLTIPKNVPVIPIYVTAGSGTSMTTWSPLSGAVNPGSQILTNNGVPIDTNIASLAGQIYYQTNPANSATLYTLGYINLKVSSNF